MPEHVSPKELERQIRAVLDQPLSDENARAALEQLTTHPSFGGFTWLWGPILYKRNRVLFRPFILSRFSNAMLIPKKGFQRIHWRGEHANILEAWLAEVDKRNDIELFKRLYAWKLTTSKSWRIDSETFRKELLSRFMNAKTAAERDIVLRKFDNWFELDEATAVLLFSHDPTNAGAFIMRHLPVRWWFFSEKREPWRNLLKIAQQKQQENFYWELYRRQISLKEWEEEITRLCRSCTDPAELVRALEQRHPHGFGLNLSEGMLKIIQQRGRDVFPYVMPHLSGVWAPWLGRGNYGKLVDFAREREWWDLWAALVRVCAKPEAYNKEVLALAQNQSLHEGTVVERLLALAGVAREWNWPGLSFARVQQLDDDTAVALYRRFPELLRGPMKLHVQPSGWGKPYAKLLAAVLQAQDESLIDYLASRIVTRAGGHFQTDKTIAEAEKLADYYEKLRGDETAFSRRAANVLGQVPAYSIYNYGALIRTNRLARLLFERSASAYLADSRSMADLVEAAEIHVQALAYRALGLNDERARAIASMHLPILLGTLLRPLQRATRQLAFGAVANAANSPETARLVLTRAREALELPDIRYPKEKLIGLIGRILHRWPELRSDREKPVVYERVAA